MTVELDEDGARKIFKLIDALEDSDDVQNVYANFDVSDEVMAARRRLTPRARRVAPAALWALRGSFPNICSDGPGGSACSCSVSTRG